MSEPASISKASTRLAGPIRTFMPPPGVRDDSYRFPATAGGSAVEVDLLWTMDREESGARLLVSGDRGEVLYDLALAGVASLRAELPIPSAGPETLEVDLEIHRAPPGSGARGSYDLSLTLAPSHPLDAPSPIAPSEPGSALMGSFPVDGLEPPSLAASRFLPKQPAPVPCDGPAHPDPGGATTAPPSPVVFAGQGSSPVPVTPSPIRDPGSRDVPTTSPRAVPPTTPASDRGPGTRPGIIGPLPMGGATPDGGIFAYPNFPSRAATNLDLPTAPVDRPPATRSPEPPGWAGAFPRKPVVCLPTVPSRPSPGGPPGLGLDPEISGGPASTGSAFLPPPPVLAELRMARGPEVRSEADLGSGRTGREGRAVAGYSLAIVAIVSAGSFLRLARPDCVSKLSTWRRDRRATRRLA